MNAGVPDAVQRARLFFLGARDAPLIRDRHSP
jgi:hypothetical protein